MWMASIPKSNPAARQALYNKNCASCHGDALTGVEVSPPLAGGEFLSNWNGLTLGDLFERIRTTMLQNAAGKLSREVKPTSPHIS